MRTTVQTITWSPSPLTPLTLNFASTTESLVAFFANSRRHALRKGESFHAAHTQQTEILIYDGAEIRDQKVVKNEFRALFLHKNLIMDNEIVSCLDPPLCVIVLAYCVGADNIGDICETASPSWFRMFLSLYAMDSAFINDCFVQLLESDRHDLLSWFLNNYSPILRPSNMDFRVRSLLLDERIETLKILEEKIPQHLRAFWESCVDSEDAILLAQLIGYGLEKSVRFFLEWWNPDLWEIQYRYDTCVFEHIAENGTKGMFECIFEKFGLEEVLEMYGGSHQTFFEDMLKSARRASDRGMKTYLEAMLNKTSF